MTASFGLVEPLEPRRLFSAGAPLATIAPPAAHDGAIHVSASTLPQVFSIDPAALAASKAQLAAGNSTLQPALNALIASANANLNIAPMAVTDKPNPSFINSHDYVSYSPYWWPNPNTGNGLPYVYRDGQVNQAQANLGDSGNFNILLAAVNNLAVAYYLTGDARYADHAAKLLEVWFINPVTRMNPNLNHTQMIVGASNGSFEGIIDARRIYAMIDALGLLNSSTTWTQQDRTAMTSWLTQYNTWLQTSSFGKSDAAEPNNQGTWFDVQHMSILLYLGQTSAARAVAKAFASKRIATQIRSDGSQPYELARADAWVYSAFNLQAMELMANLALRVGVNLWNYQAPSGGSIRKALDYLAPYANPNTPWPHNHLNTPLSQADRNMLIPLLLQGDSAYGSYTKWFDMFPTAAVATDEMHLFIDA